MANEAILKLGAWGTVAASDAVADSGWSDSTKTTISAALTTGSEADYPLLDFKLDITSGTPTDGGVIHLYFRPSDSGSDQSPDPSAYTNSPPHYCGTFVLDNAADEYYIYGVPNQDKYGTYTWKNEDGSATITATLYARGRTVVPAT